jgi:hypothetical protein
MTIARLVHGLLDKATSTGRGLGGVEDTNKVASIAPLSAGGGSSLTSPKASYAVATESTYSNNSNNAPTLAVMLACSATSSSTQRSQAKLLAPPRKEVTTTTSATLVVEDGYYGPLCQYRKGFVDHLKPKALITNVSAGACRLVLVRFRVRLF